MLRRILPLVQSRCKHLLLNSRQAPIVSRHTHKQSRNGKGLIAPVCVISLGLFTVSEMTKIEDNKIGVAQNENSVKISRHKKLEFSRFSSFASVEMGDECFMTPRDFLDSVIQNRPRPRLKRKVFNEKDVARCLSKVSHISSRKISWNLTRENPSLFRQLGDEGLISYEEYLFLLSLLKRSEKGFRIAFDVIDASGEGHIVKDEFSQFCQIAVGTRAKYIVASSPEPTLVTSSTHVTSHESGARTTLVACFFGKDGNSSLNFQEFSDFLSGFQREVLMTEFVEYSLGMDLMSEKDLAQFLFRFTNLGDEELEKYYDRLDAHMPKENRKGITFRELELMTSLINNLDDFCVIARFYRLAGKSFAVEDFSRAAKICLDGKELSPHLIETIFCLFNKDGDERLNYDEFVSVLSSRLKRRKRNRQLDGQWRSYKRCVWRNLSEDKKKRENI